MRGRAVPGWGEGDARRGRAGGRRLAGASPPPPLHLSLPPPPPPPPPPSLPPFLPPHRPRAGGRPGWPRPELLTWRWRCNSQLARLFRRRRRRRKRKRRRHSGFRTLLTGRRTEVGEGGGPDRGGRAEQTLRYRRGQRRRRRLHRRRRHHTNKDADWAAAKRLGSAFPTRHDAHWAT